MLISLASVLTRIMNTLRLMCPWQPQPSHHHLQLLLPCQLTVNTEILKPSEVNSCRQSQLFVCSFAGAAGYAELLLGPAWLAGVIFLRQEAELFLSG